METIIPEIDEIVNFYSPELIEQIARETGFVQRESKLGGTEFLALMAQGGGFRIILARSMPVCPTVVSGTETLCLGTLVSP